MDHSIGRTSGLLRASIGIAIAAFCAIFAFTVAVGLRCPGHAAWLAAVALGAPTGWLLASWLAPRLDASAISRPLAFLSTVATLVALIQLGRLSVFMTDPSQAAYSFFPRSAWEVRHNCVTAYFVAASAAGSASDVYGDSLYTARGDDPAKPRKPLQLGRFDIDVFEYPPPFLLLPRSLRLLAPDFVSFRALWFGLSGLFLLGAMLAILRLLAPATAARTLLWIPLIWLAPTTLSALQKGNVQLMIVGAAMLAMLLFERRRWALGGALLAFATVSKLYPGMFLVYLLARRQWRALTWAAGWMLVFILATSLDLGQTAYATFAHHIPRLLSGEAFPAFRNPMPTALNLSIPGMVFKLKLFGVTGMGFGTMKVVGWIYTLLAVATTWWLARRRTDDEEKPLIWLAILVVATLRSPFLPPAYGAFPAMWMLCLTAARIVPSAPHRLLVLLGWVLMAVVWPVDWVTDARWAALGAALVQSFMIGLVVWCARRLAAGAAGPAQRVHSPSPYR